MRVPAYLCAFTRALRKTPSLGAFQEPEGLTTRMYSDRTDNYCDAGVPRVILARLLFGLGGCTVICAAFPFVVNTARFVLFPLLFCGANTHMISQFPLLA